MLVDPLFFLVPGWRNKLLCRDSGVKFRKRVAADSCEDSSWSGHCPSHAGERRVRWHVD